MSEFLYILTLAALLGSGLVAGIFFAFSNFVMRALGRLREDQGIAAMQSINVTVLNPGFFFVFLGTAVVCLALALLAMWYSAGAERACLLAGGALYVLGCFLVTGIRNVPLNNRLEGVEAESEEGRSIWAVYLSRWTFWNHVRTVASFAAAALFARAL